MHDLLKLCLLLFQSRFLRSKFLQQKLTSLGNGCANHLVALHIMLGPFLLHYRKKRAALIVQLQEFLHVKRKALHFCRRGNEVFVFADEFDVQHKTASS